MRIAVVDDENEAILTLQTHIETAAKALGLSVRIDGFATSASFLDAFSPGAYPIVFLDIYIDSTDGLALAQHIRTLSESTMIVFCTTSRENMPEAFRFHAFDYLVKPITPERVHALLTDALRVLPEMNRRMNFVVNRQEVSLPFSEFVWSQSEGHYLHIKSRNGEEFTTRMTTKEFQAVLGGDKRFLVINKGIIVNMDRIRRIERGTCLMTDGTIFPIRVRHGSRIEQAWQNYIFDSLREGQK